MLFLYALLLRAVDTLRLRRDDGQTTAEYALSHLGDIVGTLATRRFPPHVLEAGERPALFYFDWPSFDDVVAGAFAQVRRAATRDPHVTGHLLNVLATVQEHTRSEAHMEALRQQARAVLETLGDGRFTGSDEERLRNLAEAVIRGDREIAR
jgi:uncharacterized membrane protein